MADKLRVGQRAVYVNNEKGTRTEYEITGFYNDFILMLNVEQGTRHKLRYDTKVFKAMFGDSEVPGVKTEEAPVETKSEAKPKVKEPEAEVEAPKQATEEAPEDASEKVDMSAYVKKEQAPSKPKPEPKVDVKEPEAEVEAPKQATEAKPKSEAKPKVKEPAPENNEEGYFFDIDLESDEPVAEVIKYVNEAQSDVKIGALMSYMVSDNASVRNFCKLFAYFWVNRGSMCVNEGELESMFEGRKSTKKELADYTNEELRALAEAAMKACSNKSAEVSAFLNLLPKNETQAKAICQLVMDGGITNYGYSLKGIKDNALNEFLYFLYLVE